MGSITQIARGAATLVVIAACEFGTHYAASTPNEQAFGLAIVVAPLLLFALAVAARSTRRAWLVPLWIVLCAALWALREPLVLQFEWAAYLEHVGFNLFMAWLFASTLMAGKQPLCSRFAAAVHGTLTPAVAQYTRQITAAWALFFLMIVAVSTLLFALCSFVTWSTFANYMTLPLVGVMFVAEHAWRRVALPRTQRSGIVATARAYRYAMQTQTSRSP
jgi:uncharacterized membrane protein